MGSDRSSRRRGGGRGGGHRGAGGGHRLYPLQRIKKPRLNAPAPPREADTGSDRRERPRRGLMTRMDVESE
jgi:hypothetical protein